jgi:hypothetical protein
MDFSQLKRPSRNTKPLNPIEIFERLPNLPGTPNDLWRGQTEALEEWHKRRKESDALIALNTGAGKTLVGLLIAQSLVNEGLENVTYLCGTIDLIYQTSKEAERLGIPCTLRVGQSFNNNLFLPIFSIPIFERSAVRRIYLSATLNYKSDIARAFGRIPKLCIEPRNDAGNGERLVLFSDKLPEGKVDCKFVEKLLEKHKVLIAVPSYEKAKNWKELSEPPTPEEFSKELQNFREADTGIFTGASQFCKAHFENCPFR